MTTDKEVKTLLGEGWVLTDASCNQMRKEVIEDKVYLFREDRYIDPLTRESVVFEEKMDYDDYSWTEVIDACETFGYKMKQVDKWMTEGEEIPLILECLFELTV